MASNRWVKADHRPPVNAVQRTMEVDSGGTFARGSPEKTTARYRKIIPPEGSGKGVRLGVTGQSEKRPKTAIRWG